jgi:ribosome-binding protein aMBF1 (putative translation factor)
VTRNNFFAEQMNDPEYAAEVAAERARIDAVDGILRQLDAERERQGLSKAELARLADKKESFVRRLLTSGDSNPTLETVVALAHELELEVVLQPR